MQLIPSIDLRGGQCVRLLHGNFAAETSYASEPRDLVAKYEAFGAEWLHIVDLDGARDGRPGNRAQIQDLAARSRIKLQVGGGLRERAAIADMLHLDVHEQQIDGKRPLANTGIEAGGQKVLRDLVRAGQADDAVGRGDSRPGGS